MACCSVEAADAVAALQQDGEGQGATSRGLVELNVLVVAGTVTTGNCYLVSDAYEAMPAPRAVVAFGVCTISGGPYWDSYSVVPGIAEVVPVDAFVPGCPPHPQDLVAALDQLATNRLDHDGAFASREQS